MKSTLFDTVDLISYIHMYIYIYIYIYVFLFINPILHALTVCMLSAGSGRHLMASTAAGGTAAGAAAAVAAAVAAAMRIMASVRLSWNAVTQNPHSQLLPSMLSSIHSWSSPGADAWHQGGQMLWMWILGDCIPWGPPQWKPIWTSEKYKRRPHIESPHGAAAYLVKGGRRPPVNMWSPLVFAAFNHKSSTTPNMRMNSNVSKGVQQVFQVSGMGRDIWGKITALRELLTQTSPE